MILKTCNEAAPAASTPMYTHQRAGMTNRFWDFLKYYLCGKDVGVMTKADIPETDTERDAHSGVSLSSAIHIACSSNISDVVAPLCYGDSFSSSDPSDAGFGLSSRVSSPSTTSSMGSMPVSPMDESRTLPSEASDSWGDT